MEQSACEWDIGACHDLPTSCAHIAALSKCGTYANMSCTWMGDGCHPTPSSCSAVVDAPTCMDATRVCAWEGSACRDPIACSELRTQTTCGSSDTNLTCLWMGSACDRVPTACASVRDQVTCTNANATLGFPCAWRSNETLCEPPTLGAVCSQFVSQSTCTNATHRGCQWLSTDGAGLCTVRTTVVAVVDAATEDSVVDVMAIGGAVAGASVGVGALAAIGVWMWKARAIKAAAQAARASVEAAALIKGRAARIKAAHSTHRNLHRVSLV